jgi:hypothetical protein
VHTYLHNRYNVSLHFWVIIASLVKWGMSFSVVIAEGLVFYRWRHLSSSAITAEELLLNEHLPLHAH